MNKILLLITISCLLEASLIGSSFAVEPQPGGEQVLRSYEGELTNKSIIKADLLSVFGAPAFFIAEAVRFEAPRPGWKVSAVQLLGWDGYNGSEESVPSERLIGLEIRDKDLNLIYKFADSQIPYSNFARNATIMYPMTIEVPQVPVSDEFYVCFYDRGAVVIGSEFVNQTSDNCFLFVENQLSYSHR